MSSEIAGAVSPGLRAGPSACPGGLAAAVRRAIAAGGDPRRCADRVARALGRELPGPDILAPAQLQGDPERYQTHLLHAEPGGLFSIAAMVWRPGQVTPVHDHLSWCVTGVLQGTEYEEIFSPGPGGGFLAEVSRQENPPGTVTGFAPPGDIHRVRNSSTRVAVSVHIYGADLSRLGSSIRRVYDLPVHAPAQ